jgi:hypothetical protein
MLLTRFLVLWDTISTTTKQYLQQQNNIYNNKTISTTTKQYLQQNNIYNNKTISTTTKQYLQQNKLLQTKYIDFGLAWFMEETGVPGENHRPVASHSQTSSHNSVSSTPCLTRVNSVALCIVQITFSEQYLAFDYFWLWSK